MYEALIGSWESYSALGLLGLEQDEALKNSGRLWGARKGLLRPEFTDTRTAGPYAYILMSYHLI